MNLHDCSLPQMATMLGQALRWLDKAEAGRAEEVRPEEFLAAWLAPDKWPLRRQIQAIIYKPYRLEALLSGTAGPRCPRR